MITIQRENEEKDGTRNVHCVCCCAIDMRCFTNGDYYRSFKRRLQDKHGILHFAVLRCF